MPAPLRVTETPLLVRHLIERTFPMLQWNSKYRALALVALLVVIAALLGNFTWAAANFTW